MKITTREHVILKSLRDSLRTTFTEAEAAFGIDSESYALVMEQFSPLGIPSQRSLINIINFRDKANARTYKQMVQDYEAVFAGAEMDTTLAMLIAEGLVLAFTDRKIYGISNFGLTTLRSATVVPDRDF